MSRKKPEIYQTFLASLKGGGYPQFGKRPNYFRFFLVKASLNLHMKSQSWTMPISGLKVSWSVVVVQVQSHFHTKPTFCG